MLIRGARKRPHPYDVKVLKHTDFLDYKELARNIIKNRTKNTEGDTVNCLNIKWLRFEKSTPYTIKYKYRIQSEVFMKLVVATERGRRKSTGSLTVQQPYKSQIPISEENKT